MVVKGYTIFSKSTGVEVKEAWKRSDDKKEGTVVMRFFKLDGSDSLRFSVTAAEAFSLHRLINKIVQDGGRHTITHKFQANDVETVTNLTLERWTNNGKTGYALIIKRDQRTINVPVSEDAFLYIGELLRALSTSQAYVETVEQ